MQITIVIPHTPHPIFIATLTMLSTATLDAEVTSSWALGGRPANAASTNLSEGGCRQDKKVRGVTPRVPNNAQPECVWGGCQQEMKLTGVRPVQRIT